MFILYFFIISEECSNPSKMSADNQMTDNVVIGIDRDDGGISEKVEKESVDRDDGVNSEKVEKESVDRDDGVNSEKVDTVGMNVAIKGIVMETLQAALAQRLGEQSGNEGVTEEMSEDGDEDMEVMDKREELVTDIDDNEHVDQETLQPALAQRLEEQSGNEGVKENMNMDVDEDIEVMDNREGLVAYIDDSEHVETHEELTEGVMKERGVESPQVEDMEVEEDTAKVMADGDGMKDRDKRLVEDESGMKILAFEKLSKGTFENWSSWTEEDAASDSEWISGYLPKNDKTYKCWITGCTSEGFTNVSNLQRHTRVTHGIDGGPLYPSAKSPEPECPSNLVPVDVKIEVGEGDYQPTENSAGGELPSKGAELSSEDPSTPSSLSLVAGSSSPKSPGNTSSISPGTLSTLYTSASRDSPNMTGLMPHGSPDRKRDPSPDEGTVCSVSPLFSDTEISPDTESLMRTVCSEESSPMLRDRLPDLGGDLSTDLDSSQIDEFGVPLDVLNFDLNNTSEHVDTVTSVVPQAKGCYVRILKIDSTAYNMSSGFSDMDDASPPTQSKSPAPLVEQIMWSIVRNHETEQERKLAQEAVEILMVNPGISPLTGLPPLPVPSSSSARTASPPSPPVVPKVKDCYVRIEKMHAPSTALHSSKGTGGKMSIDEDFEKEIDRMFNHDEVSSVPVKEEEIEEDSEEEDLEKEIDRMLNYAEIHTPSTAIYSSKGAEGEMSIDDQFVEVSSVPVKEEEIEEDSEEEDNQGVVPADDPLKESLQIGTGIPAKFQDALVELFSDTAKYNVKTCDQKADESEWFSQLWTDLKKEKKRPTDAAKMVKNCLEGKAKGKPVRPPRLSEDMKSIIRDRLRGQEITLESLEVMVEHDQLLRDAWEAVQRNNSNKLDNALYSIKRMANSEVKKPKSSK